MPEITGAQSGMKCALVLSGHALRQVQNPDLRFQGVDLVEQSTGC